MQTVHMVSSYRNCFEDGWLVLNHISQFNISIYETSKHFPEFIAAVESSQWATFYKKGKSQLRKAALILVLWSFCLAIHRDMKSKEPSIPKLRNDRFSTEYMARTHDLVFCFLMSNHKELPLNEDRVFCVQDKIFKREVIKDCLRKLEEWQVLYWTRGYCIPAIDEPKVQIGYWAINLSAFMPFYERNAPVIDQIIESISVPQTNKFLSAPRVLLRELSITDAIGSDGKMETVQKWKDVDRKKTPNYQDIQPVKTTEPYLKRYTENLRDIKISFGCFEDLSPEVQQSVLEEWQQRTEEIKRKHKKKIRAGRTTIKRSLRERYQEYRESLYTLNSPNFAKKYNEELRRLERCFLRSSFPSPHAVFHHVGKLWLMDLSVH